MWWWSERLGSVELGFTDRHGGVSRDGWASLNLARHTGDDPQAVAQNRARLADSWDAPLAVAMNQVHGSRVVEVDALDAETGEADGLVTAARAVPLMVMVADCVPVIVVSDTAVAVAHAGRVGLQRGIVETTIAAVRDHGSESLRVWLGPRACGRCYEVPAAMADEIAAVYPDARSTTHAGTAALDLGAGVRQAARAAGAEVVDPGASACTIEDEDLFSYRRQGARAGRLAGLVVRR